MQVQRILGIALLVGGVILLVMGLEAAESIHSSFSKFITDSPTDRAMWLIIGGAVCAVAGGALSVLPSHGSRG